MAFKVGDLVQVKSGGPIMTVMSAAGDNVACLFFSDELGIFQRDVFAEALLDAVDLDDEDEEDEQDAEDEDEGEEDGEDEDDAESDDEEDEEDGEEEGEEKPAARLRLVA
jgi:uncharacterized protein YodC (DUF2158 family)